MSDTAQTAEERRRGELRTGVIYPILVVIVGMFLGGLWGVVKMHAEVQALAKDNDKLRKEIEAVKLASERERTSREAAQTKRDDLERKAAEKLNDRLERMGASIIEVTTTLKGIQSGIGDMKDDMRDMRKKLDRLERKG